MATSPSGVVLAASGIRAMACSRVRVLSCSGLSLAGLTLGGIGPGQKKTAGTIQARPFSSKERRTTSSAVVEAATMETAAMEPMAAANHGRSQSRRRRSGHSNRGNRDRPHNRNRGMAGNSHRPEADSHSPEAVRHKRPGGHRFVHAGIIGVGIGALDIAGRVAGIVGADGGAGDQTRARADRSARTGIAGGRADDAPSAAPPRVPPTVPLVCSSRAASCGVV